MDKNEADVIKHAIDANRPFLAWSVIYKSGGSGMKMRLSVKLGLTAGAVAAGGLGVNLLGFAAHLIR